MVVISQVSIYKKFFYQEMNEMFRSTQKLNFANSSPMRRGLGVNFRNKISWFLPISPPSLWLDNLQINVVRKWMKCPDLHRKVMVSNPHSYGEGVGINLQKRNSVPVWKVHSIPNKILSSFNLPHLPHKR